MSKYLKITLVLLLVILTGCGTSTQTNKVIKTKANVEQQTGINEISATIDEFGNVIDVDEFDQDDLIDNNTNKQTNGGSKIDSNTVLDASTNKPNNDRESKPPVDQSGQNDKQMISVSISIDCKNILNNMDKVTAGYESFVPSSGCILSLTTYQVEENTTVLNLLKQICKDKKINYVASGGYVTSIGNIAEFIVGDGSGWMYLINDKYVNVGAGSKKLKAGDKVKWVYTCNNGDDLS